MASTDNSLPGKMKVPPKNTFLQKKHHVRKTSPIPEKLDPSGKEIGPPGGLLESRDSPGLFAPGPAGLDLLPQPAQRLLQRQPPRLSHHITPRRLNNPPSTIHLHPERRNNRSMIQTLQILIDSLHNNPRPPS